MTPDEMQATDAMFNGALRPIVAFLGWAIAAYAVWYFAAKLWRHFGLPNLLTLLPGWPVHYVQQEESDPPPDPVRSAAFANEADSGSTAFTPPGTERTEEEPAEPGVQVARLSEEDIKHILTALENRGYLCLSLHEQDMVRNLVYQTERRARFEPAGQRSKTSVIETATGLRRGGSAAYQRASKVYDVVIGQPPPAVAKQETPEGELARA